jgi:hypothetical protein
MRKRLQNFWLFPALTTDLKLSPIKFNLNLKLNQIFNLTPNPNPNPNSNPAMQSPKGSPLLLLALQPAQGIPDPNLLTLTHPPPYRTN